MKKTFLAVALFLFLFPAAAHSADAMTVQRLLFVDQVSGLGQYTPHPDTRFTLDDICTVYLELANFAMPLTLNTQDEFNVALAVDVKIRLPQSRRQIAAQENIDGLETVLRTKLTNHFFSFSFNFTDWAPGNYLLEVTARDKLSDYSVTQEIPFSLVEPTEADIRARQEREAQQQSQEEPEEKTTP